MVWDAFPKKFRVGGHDVVNKKEINPKIGHLHWNFSKHHEPFTNKFWKTTLSTPSPGFLTRYHDKFTQNPKLYDVSKSPTKIDSTQGTLPLKKHLIKNADDAIPSQHYHLLRLFIYYLCSQLKTKLSETINIEWNSFKKISNYNLIERRLDLTLRISVLQLV